MEVDQTNDGDELTIDESKLGPPFGIVINGHSLVSLSVHYFHGIYSHSFLLLTQLAEACLEGKREVSITGDSQSMQGSHLLQGHPTPCLLYTSPSPRDATLSRMPSSA